MERKENNFIINAAFQTLMRNSKDMMFVKDMDLVYVTASEPFIKMLGKSSLEDIVGKTDLEIFEEESLAKRYIKDDKKLIKSHKNQIDYIEPIPAENGHARYGSTSKYILQDDNGNDIGLIGITRDITGDYIARQHYQQELKYLFELPEDTYAVSYIDVDSWRIISQRRQNLKGEMYPECETIEELVIAALESIVDNKNSAKTFYRNFKAAKLHQLYEQGKMHLSFRYQRRMAPGVVRWVHNDVSFMVDMDNGHLCVMLSAKDIDAEKREEQRILEAAKMDTMTKLLNRQATMDGIAKVLRDESKGKHVLFMLDIDNFKSLNDTYGHPEGDGFLIELSAQIRKIFRETDVVGRIGGDEFFALMRNVADDKIILRKAEELLANIQDVCKDYQDIHLSGSIGISLYPQDGTTLDELYAKADEALYQAKRKGKNRFIFVSQK